MMKKQFLFTVAIFFSLVSFAQHPPCLTDEIHAAQVNANPDLKKAEEQANTAARAYLHSLAKKAGVRYIPVVFHVIHTYGTENITQTQINDQLRIINQDYRKMPGTPGGSSTDELATDMEFEFRLAQFDPAGHPTDGVNRVYSSLTDNATDNTKALSYWSSDRYLNIWVVRSIYNSGAGTILGYAQFPWTRNSQPNTDGIIIRYDQVGTIESGSVGQGGRTLTHELGHWLGLYHTFQNGCGTESQSCTMQGDQVCDTPPASAANYGCSPNTNSCPADALPDQVRNYMDYSDGNCMNLFTVGQKDRVIAMTGNYRAKAFSVSNLASAGITGDGNYAALPPATATAPFLLDFNTSLAAQGITLEALNIHPDTSWTLTNQAGHGDNTSIWLHNYITNRMHTRSSFFTSNYDLSKASSPVLNFDLAYARRLAGANDRLGIYVSDNYGRTETLVKTLSATEMESAALHTGEFVPASSEWKSFQVDLSEYKMYTNLRVRFEFVNLRGNNVFMDNIGVSTATGVTENAQEAYAGKLFPNPMTGSAKLQFHLVTGGQVKVEVFDLAGRVVQHVHDGPMTGGVHELEIQRAGLSNGIYFVAITGPSGRAVHRLAIR
jgi:hypothetical protein